MLREVAENNYASQCLPRFHRVRGFEAAAGARVPADLWNTAERHFAESWIWRWELTGDTVSSIIPEMTKVAWEEKKKELMQATPGHD